MSGWNKFHTVTLTLACLGTLGCQNIPGLLLETANNDSSTTQGTGSRQGAEVRGSVKGPSRLMGQDMIALIGLDGATYKVMSAGKPEYALRALNAVPLPGARVFAANAAGTMLAGTKATTTDKQGRFVLSSLPVNQTCVIVSEIKLSGGAVASFRSLARTQSSSVTVDIDAATTLVTAGVLDGLAAEELGNFSAATFKAAVAAVGEKLTAEDLPDFSSQAAVREKLDSMAQDASELSEQLTEMRGDVREE